MPIFRRCYFINLWSNPKFLTKKLGWSSLYVIFTMLLQQLGQFFALVEAYC